MSLRYINVTTVDIDGSPTTQQFMGHSPAEALGYLVDKVNRGQYRRGWDKPVIFGCIHDTQDEVTQIYDVKDGLLSQPRTVVKK